MNYRRPPRGIAAGLKLIALAILLPAAAVDAQFDRSISLPPADVEELDSASAAHLENAKRFLAENQWAEAVEAIRRVQEAEPTRLVEVDLARPIAGFERYVAAAEYCQWRLAALAAESPEALAHYRRLVDSLAKGWLREGSEQNYELLLRRVVDQAFASSAADDALLDLGDLALARGDQSAARAAWQRIAPSLTVPPSATEALRAPTGSPLWLPLKSFDFAQNGAELKALLESATALPPGCYPDTDLDLAAVRARLVLCSIFEGSRERAAVELQLLRLLDPGAEGQLGGRRGRYVDLLQSLLDESAAWPLPRVIPDWPTFAGNAARNKAAPVEIDPASQPLWSFSLPRLSADREWIGEGRLRVAEDIKSVLAYHPIVLGQTVLLRLDARGNSYVVALDLKSGQEQWRVDYSRGLVDVRPAEQADELAGEPFAVSDAHADLPRHAGVARFTLSAHGNKLFAMMGSQVTIPDERRLERWLAKDQGFLLGLDIRTQGKPLEGFPIRPEGSDWTFEGPPQCDGELVYTAMRRVEGTRTQIYLAAYELQTFAGEQPDFRDEDARPRGRLKWRTRLCSSPTLLGGQFAELTHLLVTLDGGRVYLNTQAGVVAAVNAADGRLLWLVKYPRAPVRTGNPDHIDQHLFRDLTPAVAYKDLLLVAPADSDRIFALEAATGQLAWSLPPGEAADAVHLLGAQGDVLLASGDRLYWIDANSGRLLTQFPAGGGNAAGLAAPSPRGLGRGTLGNNHVWFPTRETVFVFDVQPAATDFGHQPRLVREIALASRGLTGGNIVLAEGVLLIATGNRLLAFDELGPSAAGERGGSAGERGASAP